MPVGGLGCAVVLDAPVEVGVPLGPVGWGVVADVSVVSVVSVVSGG
ncbi:hypothetical protein ABZ639_12040 [Saccharomonospora sp. NPDC006951]